jgi:hypothetical protein
MTRENKAGGSGAHNEGLLELTGQGEYLPSRALIAAGDEEPAILLQAVSDQNSQLRFGVASLHQFQRHHAGLFGEIESHARLLLSFVHPR